MGVTKRKRKANNDTGASEKYVAAEISLAMRRKKTTKITS